MQENKPKWSKPKLIVLTRSDSGEMALVSCKTGGAGGPPSENNGCLDYRGAWPMAFCWPCEAYDVS